jgi:hypothetical protein
VRIAIQEIGKENGRRVAAPKLNTFGKNSVQSVARKSGIAKPGTPVRAGAKTGSTVRQGAGGFKPPAPRKGR